MRKRIGTKIYDTDTAVLVDTTPEGIQIYRKKNSPQFFVYNPGGDGKREMFFELPPEQAERYMTVSDERRVKESGAYIQFSPYDRDRIKRLAHSRGMSMSQFILMLVDEYERRH